MSARRGFSFKLIAFALTPTFVLLLAAETTIRLKYFFSHGHDWGYLVTPFGPGAAAAPDIWTYGKSDDVAARRNQAAPTNQPAPGTQVAPRDLVAAAGQIAPTNQAAPASQSEPTSQAPPFAEAAPANPVVPKNQAMPIKQAAPANPAAPAQEPALANRTASGNQAVPRNQMVFKWHKPCLDQMVYSTELQKEMPRTWDENCFRGDPVTQQKAVDEYRIVFVGGSTVEDAQSDAEMMTAQFKKVLPPTYQGKRITVVNAGKAGFESQRILLYWNVVRTFSPDLVLYYEAWNEQPTDATWKQADSRIAAFRNRLHETLYYRSLLYTYLIEKFVFLTASNDYFWKIDVNELRRHSTTLAREVRSGGARFIFVTQVVQFPRMWKGVDTFDYHAVDALLDRLKADREYVYDATEISALNQRLAVFYTIDLCRNDGIPVISILDAVEALGEAGRAEMFMDLGHLTVKGDKIVGELIGRSLKLSN